ncbi:MAG TPA: ATP-grasp domain-containing protein [Pilimelia sp.]|nr:ATP-grasp domain-containing protein [Pilimelia sp.]
MSAGVAGSAGVTASAGRAGRTALPTVAVLYDLGSATPVDIMAAAHRLATVVFVADFAGEHAAATRPTLAALGAVVDVTGLDPARRLAAVAALAPRGVVTFSEYRLAEAARLAAALRLPGHDADTVAALVDKFRQRRLLAEAGVQATRCAVVGADPAAALARVGVPAVIKPRTGAGSRHTVRVDTAAEFLAVAGRLPAGVEFVAEELLAGDPAAAGADFGDYVSVESVHTAAGSRQVCVTGKFPLAEPFRETGMILPAPIGDALADRVRALEAAAIRALGVRHGVTHTEVKLTPDGPRIIEVNGRLGGYVPEILKRATGVNLVRAALAAALGQPVALPEPRYRGVTYQIFLAPPAVPGRIVGVRGAEQLRSLPGVSAVDVVTDFPRAYDWRDGTQSHLGVVYGAAADHAAAAGVAAAVATTFQAVSSADGAADITADDTAARGAAGPGATTGPGAAARGPTTGPGTAAASGAAALTGAGASASGGNP